MILETPRLSLREMVPEDLDFLASMLADPDVSHYYERRFERRDAEVWLERQLERYRRDGHGLWLLQDRSTRKPLGQVGLALQDVAGDRLPEIGWMLDRPHWGRGYATEAAVATRDAAFTRWGYPAVISLIRTVNLPSQRVALRIGMTPGQEVDFHGFRHLVFGVRAPGTGPTLTDD